VKRPVLIVSGLLVSLIGVWVLVGEADTGSSKPGDTPAAACAATMEGQGVTAEGRAEMEQFMRSGQMSEAMTGMMEMSRRMGGGDPMKGMVRMMEMMGSMGGSMGSDMMSPSTPADAPPREKPAR